MNISLISHNVRYHGLLIFVQLNTKFVIAAADAAEKKDSILDSI